MQTLCCACIYNTQCLHHSANDFHHPLAVAKLQSKASPQVVWSSHTGTSVTLKTHHTHPSYYCFLKMQFFCVKFGAVIWLHEEVKYIHNDCSACFELCFLSLLYSCTLLCTVLLILIHQFLFRVVGFNLFYFADQLLFSFTSLSLSVLIYHIYCFVILYPLSSPVQPSAVLQASLVPEFVRDPGAASISSPFSIGP